VLATGLGLIVAVGGLWIFFVYGGHTDQLPKQSASMLNIADKKLSKGTTGAPVKIVEYADILCPFCAKVQSDVFPKIQTEYIDTNKVHYEVRLVGMIAPDSARAGEGAYCAAEQNKFWDYLNGAYKQTWDDYYSHDKSPEDVPLFSQANIGDFARSVSLDMFDWSHCMESGKYKAVMLGNQTKMKEIGAFGTPHFIINNTNYSGAPPYAIFKSTIDAELGKAGVK
jgi:protein-disulfide isomerase